MVERLDASAGSWRLRHRAAALFTEFQDQPGYVGCGRREGCSYMVAPLALVEQLSLFSPTLRHAPAARLADCAIAGAFAPFRAYFSILCAFAHAGTVRAGWPLD